MYDTTIAAKLLKQLESFLGRISPHFHKPVARFIGDMMYGIMAEKDVKLSSIVGEGREALVHSPRAQGGNHPEKGRGQAQQDAVVQWP